MLLEGHKDISLSLLCTVVDREKGEVVLNALEGQRAFFNLATLGKGTANSKILSYLGLGESEKTLFLSIMPTETADQVLQTIDGRLDLSRPGHGISFTTRIHEGCYHRPVHFTKDENGGNDVARNITHDLIVVVLNRGYTEEVMDVARAAGASGGTVLHARGCGLNGAEKFFGVTIQPEKEMLWILAGVEESCGIMAEIAEQTGPGTDANAISFSMPVDGVKGLRMGETLDFSDDAE